MCFAVTWKEWEGVKILISTMAWVTYHIWIRPNRLSSWCQLGYQWRHHRWGRSWHHDNTWFSVITKYHETEAMSYWIRYGPLIGYAKLRVAHAPGMSGKFSPPLRISDTDMHRDKCVMHVPWCMPGSLTSGFPWSRWRGKCSRHSRRMRNPQFWLSGKRPMGVFWSDIT